MTSIRRRCRLDAAACDHIRGVRHPNETQSVVLKRRNGYIVVNVPASRQVFLGEVGGWLRQQVGI